MSEKNTSATGDQRLQQLRLLARRCGSFSIEAGTAHKVLGLVQRGASATQVESAVNESPRLAVNVVKLASSAAFGATEIRSVRFALELLGWDELEGLTSTLLLSSLAQLARPPLIIDTAKYRQRSLVQAFVARALARTHLPDSANSLYTAGLFLDSGYLLLGLHFPHLLHAVSRTCQRMPGTWLLEAEESLIGFTHAELSGAMAEEFKLDPLIIESVAWHHQPVSASESMATAADICSAASGLADEMGLDIIEGLPRVGYDQYALDRLSLDPIVLQTTAETLAAKAITVADALDSAPRAA